MPERKESSEKLPPRQAAQYPDIVVRAGMDTIETEGAIHVADFAWLK
jgi:hypothetical protein